MTFERAVAFVLKQEGGYSNDPRDPGGETNWGISKRAYPTLNIKALTMEDAKAIYKRDYWQPAGCDDLGLTDLARLVVFDTAVNAGVAMARKLKSLYDVNLMIAARLKHYTADPHWATFGKGWTNRIAELLEQ